MEINAFDLLKQGQQRKQQKSQKARHKCDRCPKTFSNAGGLAKHAKSHPVFKKSAKKEKPKTALFETLKERRAISKKRAAGTPREKQKQSKIQKFEGSTNVKSRNRYSNAKKYKLVLHYEMLREENPGSFKDDFQVSKCIFCLKKCQWEK